MTLYVSLDKHDRSEILYLGQEDKVLAMIVTTL